ncbi:MAG: ATP-binding cassette domain-containing protein [Chloroflexi bacterium]|nr:ATP-binding cassette domain-containing protein [Chloroflexota bacterium]
MADLQIDNLSKSFGRTKAISDLTLEVRDGEFLILLGPTGAGKTTTLRCVAGLEKPERGTIAMDDASVDSLSPAERDVALVFQSYALYPRKTVFENMAFPLEARSLSANEIDTRIREIAHKLRIDTLLDRKPAQLSGGQQQRVALGRAMVRSPRLFLMDEPLTNLDFKLRVEMRAELKRLQRELAATFFYVTNDQVEAMSMADRIAVLDRGVLQQIDTPDNVYQHPVNQFVAGFIGSPRMNFVACHLERDLLVSADLAWRVALDAEQVRQIGKREALIMGIRAEDIELSTDLVQGGIEGTVYVIEPLGDRTIIDIHVGQSNVKVKASPAFEASPGQTLWLTVDPAVLHIFDKATGDAIA